MESHHNHFRKNSSNDSQKKEKEMEIEFFDNNINFYQDDNEYYLNKIFSFNEDEEEDPKEQEFLFPFPVYDFEEDNKNKDDSMQISDNNEILNINNDKNNNQINIISTNNKINNNKGEEIMEKISNYISNYQGLLNNQTAVKSPNHFDLDSNIKLAENTLPGSIISLMKNEGHPISINFIYEKIKDKFLSFRKANGAKYTGDIGVVLKSTLNSSGIFYKVTNDTYYFKEKESMDFIIKTIERELKKKISKNKKELKSSLSSKKSIKKKKKEKKHIINELSFNHQYGYKICKLNSILDNMMEKCRSKKKNNYIALSKKFHDKGIEMIQNISEKDQFIGLILCIKFFKGIIEKYIKFKNKKINIEKYLDENKFNEKILKICEKIEKIEESFNNGSNIKNNSEMMPNLKTINLSNECMDSSENIVYNNKNNKKKYFECIHK
jgi:hypothetical protein